MKVGDLVFVNVPHLRGGSWSTCEGIVVDKKVFRENDGIDVKNRTWFYILRNDNGRVEKFHEDWMEVVNESR